MKKNIFLLTFMFLSFLLKAEIRSDIKDVIVYQRGAKITRTASISLNAGKNEIVLTDITNSIDQNSVQVKIRGEAILLSVNTRTITREDKAIPLRLKALEDSLKAVDSQIGWLNSEKTVYLGEEKVITTNQKLGTEEEKFTVDELIQLSKFYRERLLDIKQKVFKIDSEINRLQLLKNKINQKLNELRYSEKKTVSEIVMNISSKVTKNVTIEVSYLTYQAGWSPVYDVRAEGADKPVKLIYKANVYQSTGNEWKNVNLTISTGNPSANNNRPIMNPWYINFLQPQNLYKSKSTGVAAPMARNVYSESMANEEISLKKEDLSTGYIGYEVTESVNMISAEYKIDTKQDVPSDGQVHLVAMQEYNLDASYNYHAVPKLDQSAYLLAKVADYGKYNLLPGDANLFFDGVYIGKSYINPQVMTDSLLLSLGQDNKIYIKRNTLQDLTDRKVIGTNISVTKGYEITVRNNNAYSIDIDVLDQIPLAQNKDIVVKLEEQGGAVYKEEYGSLLWKLQLKPNETKKIRFVYSVKYPKDKTISGL
jgi:uncharacterized protein (TIGR02231 family)